MDERAVLHRLTRWIMITGLAASLPALGCLALLWYPGADFRPWVAVMLLMSIILPILALLVAHPLMRELRSQADQRELLALVARHTDNAVIITDAKGLVEWVNDGFTRITGYQFAEVYGRKPGAILQGPATDPATIAEVHAALEAGRSIRAELVNYHRNGHPYWLAISITPIVGPDGRIRRFIAIESDISAQKDLEELLRSALKDASDLTNALSQAAIISIVSRQGLILDTNSRFCAITGYGRDELIGSSYSLLNSGHHSRRFFADLWQTIRAGQVWHGEICNRARSGRSYWVDTTIVPFLGADRRPERYLVICFDVTARKALEHALIQGEEELRFQKTLLECQLDTAIDGILVVAPNGRWLYANRRFVELWQLTSTVVAAASSEVSLPIMLAQVREPEQTQAAILALEASPDATGQAEINLRDGRTFERYSAPVRSISGDLYGRVWYYRDISERKVVERMKSEFVSVVSHELRTPLTSIRGALGLLDGGVVGELPPQAGTMITIALKNSERLIRLINDILDIEKIEAGHMAFQMQPVELSQLVDAAVEANRAYAVALKVRLEVASPLPELWVQADQDRLMQVLSNLISNAAKFSAADETVQIRLEAYGGWARVWVHDHGPGIPPEFHAHIFQKFAQADASNTRRQGGTGLGLSIARAIIERHGGQIDFVSLPAAGASFYFELPLSRSPAETGSTQPRLLVCAHDPQLADLLAELIEPLGYFIDRVGDLLRALEHLVVTPYDGVVVSLGQGSATDRALIRTFREHPHGCMLPIIAVAARVDAQHQTLTGSAVSVVDWLSLPLEPGRLAASVQAALPADVPPGMRVEVLHVESDPDSARIVAMLLNESARITHVESLAAASTELKQGRFAIIIVAPSLSDGPGLHLLPLIGRLNYAPPVLIFAAHEAECEPASVLPPLWPGDDMPDQTLRDTIMRLILRHNRLSVANIEAR